MTMRSEIPCHNCPNRHAACHASCEAYIEWSAQRRAQRQEQYERATGDRLAESRTIDSMIRIRKRKER